RATLVATRLVHPIGIVLKMHARIAEKQFRRRAPDQPAHRGIRQRPLAQRRLVAAQVGAERPVEAEQCPRRQASLPQRLAVLEAGEVEFAAAFAPAVRVQRAPVEPGTRRRQERTRRQEFGHRTLNIEHRAWNDKPTLAAVAPQPLAGPAEIGSGSATPTTIGRTSGLRTSRSTSDVEVTKRPMQGETRPRW